MPWTTEWTAGNIVRLFYEGFNECATWNLLKRIEVLEQFQNAGRRGAISLGSAEFLLNQAAIDLNSEEFFQSGSGLSIDQTLVANK